VKAKSLPPFQDFRSSSWWLLSCGHVV